VGERAHLGNYHQGSSRVGYRGVPRRFRQHCYQFIDRSDGALFGPGRAGDTTAAAAAGDGEATRAPHPLADCRDLPHLHVKGYAMIDDRDVRLVELVRCMAWAPPSPCHWGRLL
jgi:hypothetical protein